MAVLLFPRAILSLEAETTSPVPVRVAGSASSQCERVGIADDGYRVAGSADKWIARPINSGGAAVSESDLVAGGGDDLACAGQGRGSAGSQCERVGIADDGDRVASSAGQWVARAINRGGAAVSESDLVAGGGDDLACAGQGRGSASAQCERIGVTDDRCCVASSAGDHVARAVNRIRAAGAQMNRIARRAQRIAGPKGHRVTRAADRHRAARAEGQHVARRRDQVAGAGQCGRAAAAQRQIVAVP